ncbi:MAG: glycosyltransferase [Kiritimatiellae bacterium]|nr:glycosyltransferase [Kiritimatiellia bacterium]
MKTLQLVPAMAEGGVERGVVEMNRVFTAVKWANVVVSAGGRLVADIERDGGRHITLDVKSKNPLTYFFRAAKLKKILETERPDVVCAHSRVPAWLFVWANRKLGIPWITFAHGANSISRYSRVMTKGDLTVTPSTYIADYLKAAYGIADEKLRVIPRAIESGRFDMENLDGAFIEAKRLQWGIEKPKHFVVMGLGRITQLKGYDTLIRAMALLNRDGGGTPRYRLIIVGEAEARRKDVELALKSLVKELRVADDVVFAGNQRKVAECLSLADVVVSANTKKPEAFGRSMAEALAMGKPVVARAFGGALDVVRDGVDGLLVGQGDYPVLFSEAIRKVSQMSFGDLRKSALERFSFDKMANSAIAVYKEVAK